MRTQIIRNVSVALLAAASVFAQGPQKLTAQIPFGFHVGNSILPAGVYTMDTNSQSVLRLRSSDSKTGVMILTFGIGNPDGPGNRSANGRLVFHKYGDQYFLSQVWDPGNAGGRELQKTKREFEAAARLERGVTSVIASK